MSGSLGEEMCERIRVEIATGRVAEPVAGQDRILVPVFSMESREEWVSLKQSRARLWTPWGCMWVVDV